MKMKQGKNGEEVPALVPIEGVEIMKSFPGVTFESVQSNARVLGNSKGVSFITRRMTGDHPRNAMNDRWKMS